MAVRMGICTNIGKCSMADRGVKQEVPVGELFLCRECKANLTTAPGSGTSGKGWVVPFVALALLALIGYGAYRFLRRPQVPDPNNVSPASSRPWPRASWRARARET
jgi:hypothetical protein